MRISFEDGGYLEFLPSRKPGKMWIIISAKDAKNPLKHVTNSAEVDISEVTKGIREFSAIPVV